MNNLLYGLRPRRRASASASLLPRDHGPPMTPERQATGLAYVFTAKAPHESRHSYKAAPPEEAMAGKAPRASASSSSMRTPVKLEHTIRRSRKKSTTQEHLKLKVVKVDPMNPAPPKPVRRKTVKRKPASSTKDGSPAGKKRKRGSGQLAIVPFEETSSALVPIGVKRKRPKLKVIGLTAETKRAHAALVEWEKSTSNDFEGFDIGSGPEWDEIRRDYERRADEFIAHMHDLFGQRNLRPWGGSVIDSVMGAFLTQNAGDHLSSNAFMFLEAKFPNKPQENAQHVALIGHLNESFNLTPHHGALVPANNRTRINAKKKKATIESEKVDWEALRKEIYRSSDISRVTPIPDKVDWQAVLDASVYVVADTIACRGQQLNIAERMQEFLMLLKTNHGSYNLEWLRYLSPYNAQKFLLGIHGIGEKSVGCIRLLTLGHRAFPVDVNVCRIAVRLGWVELETPWSDLEEDIFHLVDEYPPLRDVQKYLWPRLCTMDKEKLYILHCGMITFGKVICRKKTPKCTACPFRAKCKYNNSREKVCPTLPPIVTPEFEYGEYHTSLVIHGNTNRAYNYEPIIEIPSSPEYEDLNDQLSDNYGPIIEIPPSPEYEEHNDQLSDIEDAAEAYYQAKTDRCFGFWKPENRKEMVRTRPQQQTNKLKTISRLRTEHLAFKLPDDHKVLEQFDKKVEGDHVSYLLVLTPSCNDDDYSVKGTVLIPCRTANRGNFPLDGTYFQNNEVFADDSSSSLPLTVPRESISHLERCTVYMGSSIHWITQGLTYPKIQHCFKNGYICVRGFDRKTREPRELCATLHATEDKTKGKKRAGDEFAVGQWVYVCLDLDFAPSRKKLPPSFYGPYPVAEKNLDRMYRLKLPQCALLDREFHVSQLKPFNGDPPTELPLLPPQRILLSRTSLGVRKLLVKWPGCPYSAATWEDLTKFQANYPQFKIQDKLLRDDVMFGLVYRRRSLTRLAKYGRVYVRRARPAVSN